MSKQDPINPKSYRDPEERAALEEAHGRIDEAQLQRWEKLLGLTSPNKMFRRKVLVAIALYFAGEDPVKEDRELLTDLRWFLRDFGKCLRQLQRLLVPVPLHRTNKRERIAPGTLQYEALFADSMPLGYYEDLLQLGRVVGQAKSSDANIRRYVALQAMVRTVARVRTH